MPTLELKDGRKVEIRGEATPDKISSLLSTLQNDKTDTTSTQPQPIGTAAAQAGQEFTQRTQNIADLTESKQQTVPESVMQTAGALGTGIGKAVGGTFMEVAKKVAPNWLQKTVGAAAGAVGQAIHPAIAPWQKLYEDINATNPRLARDLVGALELGSSALAIEQAPRMALGAATKTVEAAGAVAGKIPSTIEAAKVASAAAKTAKLEELLSPVESKAVREAAVASGRTTEPGLITKSKVIPSQTAKDLASSVGEVVDPSKPIQKNITNINREIKLVAEKQVAPLLETHNQGFNTNQIASRLNKVIDDKPLLFVSETTEGSTYRKIVDTAMKIIDKHPKNAKGLWAARKEFDTAADEMTNAFKRTASGDYNSANVSQAVRNIRREMNSAIGDLSDSVKFKESMGKMSDLYDARDILAEKGASMVGQSKAGKFIKEHPAVMTGAKIAAGAAGVGVAGKIGLDLMK